MSYISDKTRSIFIHVPKTGGMSMSQRFGGCGHESAQQIKRRCPQKWQRYFTWGFSRNPYDRALAVYSAVCQHQDGLTRKRWDVVRKMSFEEYVLNLGKAGGNWGFHVTPHARPMWHFLCDKNKSLLVNFVGEFENLKEDWAYICHRVWKEDKPLAHINKTDHPYWKDAYNRKMIHRVNEVYRDDFYLFGYKMHRPSRFGRRANENRLPDTDLQTA